MIVANFFFIKSANGLFYYGVDYLNSVGPSSVRVLVRPELYHLARRLLPEAIIVPCTFGRFVVEAIRASRRKAFIYTPSSHPLPFVDRQLVVLHDTFPFNGVIGRIKEFLFITSAKRSRCVLAYINRAEGLDFYLRRGFEPPRLVFAPNPFPGALGKFCSLRPSAESRLIVGLCGTDSLKKQHEALFYEARRSGRAKEIVFRVYGQPTKYFCRLVRDFPDVSIELVDNAIPIGEFLSAVDVVASVAQHEGFGRPIAAALQSGVPCFLLDGPVFREFFERGASFFDSPSAILNALLEQVRGSTEVHFAPPERVVSAFNETATMLRETGAQVGDTITKKR